MDDELKRYLDGIEERLKIHVSQECEKVETKLLSAFHAWASPVEQRVRSHSAAIRALDLEMETTVGRLDKIDPPAI